LRRFLIFISLHLFLFLIIIAYKTQAAEDEWSIDDYDGMIVASVPGEIVHGDKLRFVLKKGSCDSLSVLFSFLTYKNPNEIYRLEGKRIPIKINEEAILGVADIMIIKPAFNNMAHFVMLSAPQTYELDNFSNGIMASYNSRKIFTIELMDDKEFEVKKYFDITLNEWNLEKYPEKISKAHDLCLGSSSIDKYLTFKTF
jgi:hypothetical protein